MTENYYMAPVLSGKISSGVLRDPLLRGDWGVYAGTSGYIFAPPVRPMASAPLPDLRALSDLFDPSGQDSYLSLYANLTGDLNEHFFANRLHSCQGVLKDQVELRRNLEAGYEQALDKLRQLKGRHGVKGAAVFAAPRHDYFQIYELALPVEDLLVVDASPYVRPLTRLAEEWESAALALVDQQHFKLYLLSISGFEEVEGDSERIIGRHQKGGCSQARFQRLRRGAIKEFLEQAAASTAEVMAQEGPTKLVVAGPGQAKKDFVGYLPAAARKGLAGVVDFHFKAPGGELVEAALEELEAVERAGEAEHLSTLQAEILSGGLAVYGLRETREALVAGQAELLLVAKGLALGGWKCTSCQNFGAGRRGSCRACGGATDEVDFVEELVEAAHATEAEVDFVEDEEQLLEELGGVAALLRYR